MQASLFEAGVTGAAAEHRHATVLSKPPALIAYHPNFMESGRATELFAKLCSSIQWNQEEIVLYGKRHPIPRLTAWYGDPGSTYKYSGIDNAPRAWTPELLEILRQLEDATEVAFNSVLLNRYRSGNDSLSWHSDDEPELGPEPFIASLSLGAARAFNIRSKDRQKLFSIRLEHGSLLVMSGQSQSLFQHSVPKEKRITGERINLTFRVVNGRGDSQTPLRAGTLPAT
jgi:alkylated DNA repair dioxygenase AlkB